jgi:hypothetical protein
MSETHKEQIARVEMAASDRDTWDLSDNDVLALKAVLEDRAALLAACASASQCEGLQNWGGGRSLALEEVREAIDRAEGRK